MAPYQHSGPRYAPRQATVGYKHKLHAVLLGTPEVEVVISKGGLVLPAVPQCCRFGAENP